MGRARLAAFLRPIAHRGLHDEARGIVENTRSAFEAAIAGGYGIEFDVQPARGMTPMVFHDATLDRLTEAVGPLVAHDPEVLRQVAFRGTDDRMAALSEILELVAGRVPILVEVKSNGGQRRDFWRRIGEALQGYPGPAAIMSFDPDAVAAVARHAPECPRGLISCAFNSPAVRRRLALLARFRLRHLLGAFEVDADFVAYDIRALPALAPLLARHVFVRPLFTWTVRTPKERARAERWADTMIFEGLRP